MKQLLLLAACFFLQIIHAQQFIEFDFDNATATGGTVTQDVFVNGDGYRLTLTHGAAAGAMLTVLTGTDAYFHGSVGSRPQQNWTISLIKNGQAENFNFVSVAYQNTSNGTNHTMIVADANNNVISNQAAIAPGNTGTFVVDNMANATNLSSARIVGLTFTATFDVYFNNLRLIPVSLLSSDEVVKQQIRSYQPNANTLVLEGDTIENATVTILNLQGQQVYTATASDRLFIMDTQSLNSGLYIATITNNGFVAHLKFVL